MPQYTVRITRQARAQLTEVRRYIELELLAPKAALATVRALRKEIRSLAEMPYRFPVLDKEPWQSEGVRKTQAKNYYIYYWINEDAKFVQVIGVIYVRRDQERQLQWLEKE